jgi:predicted transcriptional regulator
MQVRRHRLGQLEVAVLGRLWSDDAAADVKGVHEAVGAPRGISPNTVHSALERLVRKGLVQREKSGRAYRYRALLTHQQWMERGLDWLANEVPGGQAETLLAAFVDRTERAGDAQLAELERLVRARRRRARRAGV